MPIYSPPLRERIIDVMVGEMTTTQIADALAERYDDFPPSRMSLEDSVRSALNDMRGKRGVQSRKAGRTTNFWHRVPANT